MKTIRVAQRYAKALYDLAAEEKLQHKVYADMQLISTISKEKDFKNLLVSPIINSGKKVEATVAVFDGQVQKLTLEFLKLIIRKKREYTIPQVAVQFNDIYKAANEILSTEIQSAVALDENTRNQLVEKLKKQTKANEIDLKETLDEDLLGGFVLKYQNQQYDASIRRQLSELKKSLT